MEKGFIEGRKDRAAEESQALHWSERFQDRQLLVAYYVTCVEFDNIILHSKNGQAWCLVNDKELREFCILQAELPDWNRQVLETYQLSQAYGQCQWGFFDHQVPDQLLSSS